MEDRSDYIDDNIETLRTFPARFEALVTSLADDQLDLRIPGEWSIRQIVHHVADSHMSAVWRFKKPLTEDRPRLMTYNQDALAELADYNLPLAPSLQILHGLHARLVALLKSLTVDQGQRVGMHPDLGELTVEDVAQIYASHGEEHIAQIKQTLAYHQIDVVA